MRPRCCTAGQHQSWLTPLHISTPDLLHSTEDAIVQAMAAEPSPEELDVVRDAVRQVVGDGKIAKFRDADLALLWRQRFEAKEDLLAATSEQLARIELPAALIAHLKAGECVGSENCAPIFTSKEAVIGRKPHRLAYAAARVVTSVVKAAVFSWLAVISDMLQLGISQGTACALQMSNWL